MLTRTVAFLTLAAVVGASQMVLNDLLGSASLQRGDFEQLYQAYPDYTLNLNERRLIQFDSSEPPVVVSELEKVCTFSESWPFSYYDSDRTQSSRG